MIPVDFDREFFPKKDWSFLIYTRDGVELKEDISPDMPQPSGIRMFMRVYVDSDHAGDMIT